MDGREGRCPFLLRPREPHLIAFAGIYERRRNRKGNEIDTVTILTCDSNQTVSPLHNRMPVVLPPEHLAAWLNVKGTSPKEATALLRSAATICFEVIEMHPKMNDSKRDKPGILEPF